MADCTKRRFLVRLFPRHRAAYRAAVVLLAAYFVPTLATAADEPSGGALYKELCAQCHGRQGQGVEDQGPDLAGEDRSLRELRELIDETMPEDDPAECTGDYADRVARYVYHRFSSSHPPAGTSRPRIELARLTARQYENAVADLIGGFVGTGKLGPQRGLKAQYYNARNFQTKKRVLTRTDPKIAFRFGKHSPVPGKIGDGEFSIRWQGSVRAEETGSYEFFLTTENGARLWVNNNRKPLIDAWVQSGAEHEHHASLRLLGGRAYPIRVEVFKFKEKTASVELAWQPPHKAREVVPQRNLAPDWSPPTLVMQTELPADDSSVGYARGTSVSAAWDRATTRAAITIANQVVAHLAALAKCKPDAPDRRKHLQAFCYRLAERAFRRPLSPEEKRFFVDRPFQDESDPGVAVKRVVLLVLQSPRFLYLGLYDRAPDDHAVAERLSFGLWDSLPDATLRAAAARGKLHTPQQIARQARRMLADPRTRAKLRDFFHHWLNIDQVDEITKDGTQFPWFSPQVAADLRTSLDLFWDDVVWGAEADFRRLLLADRVFVNARLAKCYGIEVPPGAGFHKVALNRDAGAGILTHPYLMARFAYHGSTSPIHRGVFIVRSFLGRPLKPPPVAVAPLAEGDHPEWTTRERVVFQTRAPACQTCHRIINPLGFSLEHYDAVGRYRAKDNGKSIDATGRYMTLAGDRMTFRGAPQLAEFLSRSQEVRRCFVEQMFHNIVKQPVSAFGPERLESLDRAFAEADYNIQTLLVEIMKASALKANEP